MAYQYHNKNPQPIRSVFSEADKTRFWSKVDKSSGLGPKGDCWEWKEYKWEGYGKFTMPGEKIRAHRAAYFISTGDNPGTLGVLHKCDNRPCVNPAHLFLGDARANRLDCLKKGRQTKGLIHGPAASSVFTPERIKAIRKAWASGLISQRELALIAGTKSKTMSDILRRKSWDYPECG